VPGPVVPAPVVPAPVVSGLWRRTPPAIFSPVLGFFGLGLAWRQAAVVFALPAAISELMLGAATLLYGFCLLAYLAKVARRSAVLLEEVGNLPGRAGIAAMSISMMILAVVFYTHNRDLSVGMLAVGMAMHLGFAGALAHRIVTRAGEHRTLTPLWHLHFVGFIVGALAAADLGMRGLALALFVITVPTAALIWAASLRQCVRGLPPPPLRPLLTIHLAPASLFATVSTLLGYANLAFGFAIVAIALFLTLLSRCLWMAAHGFSPIWGAFTFPVAAFLASMLFQATPVAVVALMGGDYLAPLWTGFGGLALMLASVAVPYITFRVMRDWATGALAATTNAATA
jgi:tellurite resistance protein